MQTLLTRSLAACAALLLTHSVAAHGGEYRGPADVVPPDARATGRPTPGRGAPRPAGSLPGGVGPVTPAGSNPLTPMPPGPLGSGALPVTPRGIELGVDLSRWQFWWEFNKDPYLDLKAAVHRGAPVTGGADFHLGAGARQEGGRDTLQPDARDIAHLVLPALRDALASTNERDIVSAVLVALAKIGQDGEDLAILPRIAAHLRSPDQEIRETAALALGIAQMPGALDDLTHLLADDARGRELAARAQVDDRTRAFAAYAAGLIAHASRDADVKRRAFEALRVVLTDATIVSRDVLVGAICGIRLLRPDPAAGDDEKALHAAAHETLWNYYRRELGPGRQQVQAHAITALATLFGRGAPGSRACKDALIEELRRERSSALSQSAALALGVLCQPQEADPSERACSEALLECSRTAKDAQTRYFALIALARIGGETNRTALLQTLARGSKALVKPWAALALGVLAHARRTAPAGVVDDTISAALRRELAVNKNPETLGAIAVALGLAGDLQAAPDLQELLARNRHQDELAGYVCIGLALMEARGAVAQIRDVVAASVRRPDLFKQAAIALGRLGDKDTAAQLASLLADSTSQTVAKLGAIAAALGVIGDRSSLAPLAATLRDESLPPLARAFAAAALGGVCDKEPLPWNSKIGGDLNYRAAVETLVNGGSGILEIL
jgi:hypothetical protein